MLAERKKGRLGRQPFHREARGFLMEVTGSSYVDAITDLNQARYLSAFSPALTFSASQVAIRPRPDHVPPVLGSRYFTFALLLFGWRFEALGSACPLLVPFSNAANCRFSELICAWRTLLWAFCSSSNNATCPSNGIASNHTPTDLAVNRPLPFAIAFTLPIFANSALIAGFRLRCFWNANYLAAAISTARSLAVFHRSVDGHLSYGTWRMINRSMRS